MKEILIKGILLALLFVIGQEMHALVINEINCDNPGGPDTQEFVELYGDPNQSLDGIVFVLFDGNSGTSYSAIDLDGYFLDENGFFVIGNVSTTNVDFVVGNSTIQNGQDGIAIYYGDASAFPDGTTPTTIGLIDAAVYGTEDAAATNLITALGLDISSPGYTQLDETIQVSGNDLALSRIPDGGNAFDYTLYVLQESTPGISNLPSCFTGDIALTNGETAVSFCDNENPGVIHFQENNIGSGDSLGYIISNTDGDIVTSSFADTINVQELSAGDYEVYGFAFTGELNFSSLLTGNPVDQVTSDECFSFSGNTIAINVLQCSGCEGGIISGENGDTTYHGCASIDESIVLNSSSTSANDTYLYIVADLSGNIVSNYSGEIELANLDSGQYMVYGLSFMGEVDESSLLPGQGVLSVTASVCQEFSENTYTVNIFNCAVTEPCTEVFISEYLEGFFGTKALEIFNPTLNTINLDDYQLFLYPNGNTSFSDELNLSGTLGPLNTLVIANPGTGGNNVADPVVLAAADIIDDVVEFSGNDAIELTKNGVVIDVIGIVGDDPGTLSGWQVEDGTTRNTGMIRNYNVQLPVNTWAISSSQWQLYDNTDFSHLGQHSFELCTDEPLAGIIDGDFDVQENAGVISFGVTALNLNGTVDININVLGGGADLNDFNLQTSTLTFDGTSDVQYVLLEIIDDLELEYAENIEISISSVDPLTWLDTTINITILENDLICDGGSVELEDGTTSAVLCYDSLIDPVIITVDNTMPDAEYFYVITNFNDSILVTTESSSVDMNEFEAGIYRIYGVSFMGVLNEESVAINESVFQINADTCVSVSENFIQIKLTQCTPTGCISGSVSLDDGATFVVLCKDNVSDYFSFTTTANSNDDEYIYLLTNQDGQLIGELEEGFDFNALEVGSYHISGFSFLGMINEETMIVGDSIGEITATICEQISENFIEFVVSYCSEIPECNFLFISEYMENSNSNKALEMYNPGNETVSLDNYTIYMYSNGSITPTDTLILEGDLPMHEVYVILSSGNGVSPSDPVLVEAADTLHDVSTFSGNDAIELLYQGAVVDRIGNVGEDPGLVGWTFGNSGSANHDLVRREEVNHGNPDWQINSGQWITYEPWDYSHFGWHDAFDCTTAQLATVGFSVSEIDVLESTGELTLSINAVDLDTPLSLTILISGSAVSGLDYFDSFPLTIDFPAGNSSQTITLTLLEDALIEGTENIVLTLQGVGLFNWTNQQLTIDIEDTTIGVFENENAQFRIYPNPAQNKVTLESLELISSWILYDVSGNEVLSGTGNGSRKMVLDLEGLSSGIYMIRGFTANDRFNLPVMIMK